MKAVREIEELTNQTLNSLDNLQPVEANEYLFAKIQNRMQQGKQNAMAYTRLMLRLSLALILFLGINVASFYFLNNSPKHIANKPKGITAFSEAYFAGGSSYNY